MSQQDKSVFESLFRTHYVVLCRTSFRIVGDHDIAEDIVQNVFCALWQENQSVTIKTSLLGYLNKSVINQSLNYIRGQRNRAFREDAFGISVYNERNFTEETYLLKELETKVNQVIDALPPVCRLVFILSRYEELSYKEIAIKLDVSIKTVENHMVKALKFIRKHLGEIGIILIYFFTK